MPSNIVFDGISQKKPVMVKPTTANHHYPFKDTSNVVNSPKLSAKMKFYDRIEKIEMIDRL